MPLESLYPALYGLAAVGGLCWVLSLATGEHGWIDRVWSLSPPLFVLWFVHAGGYTTRGLVMLALATLWGARLTYNFARKGGYRIGGEDYRWKVMRADMSKLQWALFNIFFICVAQNAILLGMALPAWPGAAAAAAPFGAIDAVATALFLVFLVGETVADEQQWRFQEEKRRRRESGEPIERGFLDTGLFRYSRHPNFFCEMGMWWAFYLLSVGAGAGWLNLTLVGPLVLTLQFQGSTNMTEKLSVEKYPDYADYQRRTRRLIPGPPKR